MAVIKRKVKKKAEESSNLTEMTNMQLEFHRVKEQGKLLKKREEELKKKLDAYMSKVFTPDAKGHYLFTTTDEKGNRIHLQKQARRSVKLNEEVALDYLRQNGFDFAIVDKQVVASDVTQDQVIEVLEKHASHLLENKVSVDEPTLEQLVTSEQISMEDFEAMCEITTTYAMTFIDDKKLQETGEENAPKANGKKV